MTVSDITGMIQARDGVAVVLYTKPACVQCDQTKKRLDAKGIYYTAVDVTEDESALDYVKHHLGYMGAPVVYVSTPEGDLHWYGFRPDLIKAHITEREEAAA